MISDWVAAFRLRTLPLALASVIVGTCLAVAEGFWDTAVFAGCCITTSLLQVLSNLANDYGDSVHGADHDGRKGPSRAVQTGKISPQAMRRAVIILALLALIAGIATLLRAFPEDWQLVAAWMVIGLICIGAAITYTAGRKPYGYMGLGDFSVVLFFGLVAVLGTCFLFTRQILPVDVLPALSTGMLAAGVLNINNIRDIDSDRVAGKFSIPVRIGLPAARNYQSILLWGALILTALYVLLKPDRGIYSFLFLASAPVLFVIDRAVRRLPAAQLDPWLRRMSFASLLFATLFGAGVLLT